VRAQVRALEVFLNDERDAGALVHVEVEDLHDVG
jgi:hypothetical protein